MLYQFFYEIIPMFYQMVVLDGISVGSLNMSVVLLVTIAERFLIWLFCYLFMGFGLFTMAKRREIKIAYLAFIPFASTYLLGKLVGEVNLFGLKIKRLGLIAMLIEIGAVILLLIEDIIHLPVLIDVHADVFNEQSMIYLDSLIEGIRLPASIIFLVYDAVKFFSELAFFLLLLYLFRNYAPKSSFLFAILALFFDFLGPIFVFAIRKNSCEEYREYMRMKMHSMYGGGNPYQYDDGTYKDPYDLSKQNGKEEKTESPFEEYDDKN